MPDAVRRRDVVYALTMPPSSSFESIAHRYEQDSLVQKAASATLFDLLQIGPREDVLDLGCGTGQLTCRIGEMTDGRVVGVDPSRQMIAEAAAKHGEGRVRFVVGEAEGLAACAELDVVFCNSAFQWFQDGRLAIAACYRALRPGGRMGIQAPATSSYSPNFLVALEQVARDPATGPVLAHFRAPWFFLESAQAYAALFETAGFKVPFARIQTSCTKHAPDEVMRIFESGAAAGYLAPASYAEPPPPGYAEALRAIVQASFRAQAGADGAVDLVFNRIYLVAMKP
jgi:ubiquinone/menaquinone biosynthesis C-methylase UbiE